MAVFPQRVYYEDTDAGGVVYYARYLHFAERARTEWLRCLGFDHRSLWQDAKIAFVVRHVEADYLRPARLDDWLEVQTNLVKFSAVRLVLEQKIKRDQQDLVILTVTLAVVDDQGRPQKMPVAMLAVLGQ